MLMYVVMPPVYKSRPACGEKREAIKQKTGLHYDMPHTGHKLIQHTAGYLSLMRQFLPVARVVFLSLTNNLHLRRNTEHKMYDNTHITHTIPHLFIKQSPSSRHQESAFLMLIIIITLPEKSFIKNFLLQI